MLLGVDYYPEQWDESMMDSDLDNIIELGCNVIRIGEFCWHIMEKKEGEYDFSFFDKVIQKAKSKGLKVIMGTPTATIPAWLAKKHPEILSEFENGRKRTFGGRHVYCFNSRAMYEYSEKIIRAEIEHFKNEEAIVAWQIDNELGHESSDVCYCHQCQEAFRKYLEEKFRGDINALNETYGTVFWSQEYNEFDEIPTPMETITTHNPSLRLDWERFRKKSITDFARFQAELIRGIQPTAVVIHDFSGGGLEKHCDFSEISKYLDIAAYNNYPVWGGQKEPIPPHEIAFGLDYIRGLKQKNFWITEAIMGAQGHDVTGFLPRPGQAKMWSCQGMARGCSALMYFRYRGDTKGAEQFCYGILDSDNVKRRKFYEVKSFFSEISKFEKQLESPVGADVAVVYDYDSLAAFRIQKQSILLDCQIEMKKLYKPFYDRNIMVDVIPAWADISKYKILIIPLMIIGKPEFQERIKNFTAEGGTVILTYRTAVKDSDNNLTLGKVLPVGYSDFAGIEIAATESLQDINAFPIKGHGAFRSAEGYGGIFRDMITAREAEVLYSYSDEFYSSFAAVTCNRWGSGMVYYLGCSVDDATLCRITEKILEESGIKAITSPDGVEIVSRGQGGDKITIIINHNPYKVKTGDTELGPYEYSIK